VAENVVFDVKMFAAANMELGAANVRTDDLRVR